MVLRRNRTMSQDLEDQTQGQLISSCWLIDGGSVAFVCFGGLGKGCFETKMNH